MIRQSRIRSLLLLAILLSASLLTWVTHAPIAAAQGRFKVGIDGSSCVYETISDAINAFNTPNDVIYVSPGTYNETLPDIAFDMTLVAAEADCRNEDLSADSDTVVVDGGGGSADSSFGGLVKVKDGATVTFRHMTLQNATSSNGGILAVRTGSAVTLDDANIKDGDGTLGGGVSMHLATLTLLNGSEIVGNTAKDGAGVYMFTNSTLNLTNGYIGKDASNRNTASGDGGGIYSAFSTLTLPNLGHVTHNHAENGGGVYAKSSTINFNSGGGKVENNYASNDGGGIYADNGTLTMIGGGIRDNEAEAATSGSNGGGIFATGTATLNINSAVLEMNAANNGGGIYLSDGASVTLRSAATVQHNSALADGGGIAAIDVASDIVVLDFAKVFSNTAGNDGGGLFVHNLGYVTVATNGVIEDNVAGTSGGGLLVRNDSDGETAVFFDNADLLKNRARFGGGMSVNGSVVATFQNESLIADNWADRRGGGIELAGLAQLTMRHSDMKRNMSDPESGSSSGGGIYATYQPEITLEHAIFESNVADSSGGAILTSGPLSSTATTFATNSANFGAAIYSSGSSNNQPTPVVIENTQFFNNEGNQGVALFIGSSDVILRDSLFAYNEAAFYGGGVYASGAYSLSAINNDFAFNSAENDGGGLWLSCRNDIGEVRIARNNVYGNTANRGGGIFVDSIWTIDNCQIEIANMNMYANSATADGGAIFLDGGEVTIGTQLGAAEDGGCTPSALPFDTYCSMLTGNSAERGGAIFVQGSYGGLVANRFLLETTAVFSNSATTAGSGIYLTQDETVNDPLTYIRVINNYMRGNEDSPVIQSSGTYTYTTLRIFHNTIVDNRDSPFWFEADETWPVSIWLGGNLWVENDVGPYTVSFPWGCSQTDNMFQARAAGSSNQCFFGGLQPDTPYSWETTARGPHRLGVSALVNGVQSEFSIWDMDMNGRPHGDHADMGAFERNAVPLAVGLERYQVAGYRYQVTGVVTGLVLLMAVTAIVARASLLASQKHPFTIDP